ncbi:MAG: methylglyoxal synthase [Clostridia bacterium]|nr:methylglyoxal synthase [Clostridia bacterium]
MDIAIIADNNKKELMIQFCTAYCGILKRHTICATHTTGKYISEATGLEIDTFLMAGESGMEQISSRISFGEIDLVFYFRSTDPAKEVKDAESSLLRMCDVHNVPLATNIATAEALVLALDNGTLDWRELVNPRSAYNMKKKGAV